MIENERSAADAAPAAGAESSARRRLLAELEVGQLLAGHRPSEEALARAGRVLDGTLSLEDARREITAVHAARADSRDDTPVTEYEVLDLLFESLPDGVTADLYDVRDNLPRAEFYIKVRGECWRVLAQPHPHPLEPEDVTTSPE